MWAQTLRGPFRFEQVEVAAPDPAALPPGHVLLAPRAGAICGSDLPNFRGGVWPHPAAEDGWGATRAPGFPMHEVAGEVVASRHPDHSPGDLVVGWASMFDAIAELVVTDGEGLAPYDPSLAPSTAVLLQPLACVLYAVEQLGDVTGQSVAVIGQGPIGLLFSSVLKARGAARVTGVDPVDRGDVAGVFGVDETVTARAERWAARLSDADRPSVVVEAVGHQVSTLQPALDAAAPGAQVFYFGVPDDPVYPFDMMTFLRKNLTLRSGVALERRRVLAAAGEFLAAHPELREGYVTHVHPVADVEAAFTAAISPRPGQLKIAVDMT
ncbi:zinc-binding dehydrogenase [Geodermatophilus nigrescens]|uniref:Threonine dehydrogenase n=1 Tax=Geodermatophilus nigrescens TaxID=1070870 RepID=A0A1M5I8X2_9ACTN|nr:zinc-binding dehydrogenase [Geodermatophilus nigrescens]SHG24243.1 Threonine dehydrogenase [Geodermatophilus nigrescens]